MTYGNRTSSRSVTAKVAAVLCVVALLAAACGGKKLESKKNDGKVNPDLTSTGESGLAKAGKPVRGGKIVYGLEAETGGGYCLAEGQLAISGIMVARAFYDTLAIFNAAGKYVPYLAKSVTPDATYKTWTITLRPGIKFHDGSPLNATVVKNNIDAYRGKYPGRSSLLFSFVLNNIASVATQGDMAVVVKMTKPWVAFPAHLFSSGRFGMMAQAQLDDKKTCDRKLIGTGPFVFDSWQVGTVLKGHANPTYWQKAPDGKPYPYVSSVEFRPIVEGAQRINALQSGTINMMHSSSAEDIGGTLKQVQKDGKTNMYVTQDFGEVTYVMLNAAKPPFDDVRMRKAMAMGIDRDDLNNITNNNLPTIADGPFAPGSVGYLKSTGFPKFDLAAAKKLVQDYVKSGGKSSFVLNGGTDPQTKRFGELIQEKAKAVGVTITLKAQEQAAGINDAIGGGFQAILWRNHPGGDPDTQYVWWYDGNPDPKASGNPVNFGRINDPLMDKLLDQGRAEPDEAKRKTIYESLNREFGKQVWNVWAWFTPWAVAEGKKVHGILGPDLPDGSKPNPGLPVGHTLIGAWIDK